MSLLEQISTAVQQGKAKDVVALVQEALDSGATAQQILDEGLLKGMSILGVKFKNNEVFVPEVLIAARALNRGTELLKPRLVEEGVEPIGRVVIGTVKGDLHDIGKNLVKMMLEGAGFAVIDLGVDVSEEKFIEAVKEHKPQILALSALLTTTMNNQQTVIEALKAADLRNKVKVMVGGAPVTQSFCDLIGADAYAPDAASAAEVAKSFVA
ncbi:MAG TPA: corrinoid protein [Candidatus Avimonas sp.]|jgi:5-methyltetrahydrofolate--homocysteine methyltransferase|nr:corrinoid protein [Candidatus Avimonas sp.]HQA16656.1 corrinoid protein [Candidatus Avimonas sp.]HQD38471.1 corrinoid protein [Candidatus Avimonas sp.]